MLNDLGIPDPKSRKNFWKAILVGFVVIVNTAVLVLGTWTLISIREGLSNHTGTLNAIQQETQAIRGYQKASAEGKTTVDKLLVEAGQVSSKLEADMLAICQATRTDCP